MAKLYTMQTTKFGMFYLKTMVIWYDFYNINSVVNMPKFTVPGPTNYLTLKTIAKDIVI